MSELFLVPGLVAKGSSDGFRIRYATASGAPLAFGGFREKALTFTSIRSPSGSGKSTLIGRFVRRLRDKADSPVGELTFTVGATGYRPTSVAVGVAPQNLPIVKHWPIVRLLSKTCWTAEAVFGSQVWTQIRSRRVGELSGGQQKRLYACSVVEGLADARSDAAVLVLDETLDGLNPVGAGEFLQRLGELWTSTTKIPMHVLLVTHLPSVVTGSITETYQTALRVIEETSTELVVEVRAGT